MKFLLPVQLALLLSMAAAVQGAPAPTVEEIVERHLEAIGGEEAWRTIRSLRLTGWLRVGATTAPVEVEYLRPGLVRIAFELQGLEVVQAWDGERGWARMPVLGRPGPDELAPEESRRLAALADFDGPWVSSGTAPPATVELLGADTLDERPCWRIRLRSADGPEMISWIDGESWLEMRRSVETAVGGETLRYSTDFADHQPIDDVVVPLRQTTRREDRSTSPQRLRFETVEIDPALSPDRFAPP